MGNNNWDSFSLVPEFRHSVDVEKEKWDEKEQAVLEPVDQDLAG